MLAHILRNEPLEVYRIETTPHGFTVSVSEKLLTAHQEKLGEERSNTLLPDFPREIASGVVTFRVRLPFISFPNRAHKKLDYEELKKYALNLSSLLCFCNWPLVAKEENKGLHLSERKQLVVIETGYHANEWNVASPVSVGFSPHARQVMADKVTPGTDLSALYRVTRGCEAEAFNWYFGMSCTSKKDYAWNEKLFHRYRGGMGSISVAIRSCGTPSFVVPGNCACLGANPDQFKHDYELDSHNLDTPLQQLTMFCGVVTFWNKVLRQES